MPISGKRNGDSARPKPGKGRQQEAGFCLGCGCPVNPVSYRKQKVTSSIRHPIRPVSGPLALSCEQNSNLPQPIYAFGKFGNLMEAVRAGVAAEEAAFDETSIAVAFETKELYYGLLLALDLRDLVVGLIEQLEERRLEFEDNPDVTLANKYKLRLALVELKHQAVEAGANADLARAALAWKVSIAEADFAAAGGRVA